MDLGTQMSVKDDITCVSVYCTVKGQQNIINVAIYDSVQRSFQVAKFFDNDHFSCMESFLIQIQPSEDELKGFQLLIVLPDLSTKKAKIIEILEGLEIQYKVLTK